MPKETETLSAVQILVVDDQLDVRRGLKKILQTLDCRVTDVSSGEEAWERLRREEYHLVITDIKMEGMSGVDLFHKIQGNYPETAVILITGYGTIEQAVSCLRAGAEHFLTKPFDNDEILQHVERIAYRKITVDRIRKSNEQMNHSRIVAESEPMQKVLSLVKRVSGSNIPVLIQGESGTGKELIAHAIHDRSATAEAPFLAINCASLPDSLLESELFGYKQGAFTGAYRDSTGLFQQARGGTIFLDEVSSMSMTFQAKLLRVLEQKVVRPLGAEEDKPIDFRLISASNKDLDGMVEAGEFREDLLYRIKVFQINLPTLDERPKCIPALAEHFICKAHQEIYDGEGSAPTITPEALRGLQEHTWKGNVREFENTLKRALVVCDGSKILPFHLGLSTSEDDIMEQFETYEEGKRQAITNFQERYITRALEQTSGNVTRAADLCGITRAAMQRIMKKLNIEREQTAHTASPTALRS